MNGGVGCDGLGFSRVSEVFPCVTWANVDVIFFDPDGGDVNPCEEAGAVIHGRKTFWILFEIGAKLPDVCEMRRLGKVSFVEPKGLRWVLYSL